MAQKIGDRTKETSTTSGTGTLSLLGAVANFQTFGNAIGNGNSTPYLIDDGAGNWEATWGTVTTGTPDTITRGALIKSSTGSRVSFGAGTKTISCVSMAELLLWVGSADAMAETSIASATTTDLSTINTFCAAISGTVTITSFGSQPNTLRKIRFTGTSLVLTHNATSLILPGSGNWRVLWYQRAAAPIEFSVTANGMIGGAVGNLCSITLTPGRWKLSGTAQENGSGAGANTYFTAGISANSASFTGCVQGKSKVLAANYVNGGTATLGSASIIGFEVTVAVNTSFYLVAQPLSNSVNYDGWLRADPLI
jgi:hypothetical protein